MSAIIRRLYRSAALCAVMLAFNAWSADGHYTQWRIWFIALFMVSLLAHMTALLVADIVTAALKERDE